jgi:hypothetical protein
MGGVGAGGLENKIGSRGRIGEQAPEAGVVARNLYADGERGGNEAATGFRRIAGNSR